MTVYKGKSVQIQAIAMTRDEYIASEHAAPGYYPLDDAPGYFVTDGAHFKAWYAEDEFTFLFEIAGEGGLMSFPEAVKAMGQNKAVRRQGWPDDASLRTQAGRFMTVTIRRAQRILAPYVATPADAAAQDWVVVAVSAPANSK